MISPWISGGRDFYMLRGGWTYKIAKKLRSNMKMYVTEDLFYYDKTVIN